MAQKSRPPAGVSKFGPEFLDRLETMGCTDITRHYEEGAPPRLTLAWRAPDSPGWKKYGPFSEIGITAYYKADGELQLLSIDAGTAFLTPANTLELSTLLTILQEWK